MLARAVLFVHLLLSPIVFSKDTVEAFEFVKVALLLVTAIGLLLLLLPATSWPFRIPRDPVSLGAVLFLGSAVASTATSMSPLISLRGAHESFAGLVTILAYVVLFFATRSLCETVHDARRLLLAPVIGATVAAGYAVAQIAHVDPIGYQRLSGLGRFVRAFGTLGHPNMLAGYLVTALPLMVYFLVRALRRRQRGVAIVLGLAAALAIAAIAASVSRAAWLALAAMALVLLAGALALGVRARTAALGAAGVLGTAAVLFIGLWLGDRGGLLLRVVVARAQRLTDSASRQHLWRAAWDMFRDAPIFGAGLDTFQIAFAAKRTVVYWMIEWNASPTKAHNEALNILATQGLVGGLALGVLTVGLLVAALRRLRDRAFPDRPFVLALGAAVVGFYVQDVFGFTVAGCGTLFVTVAALLSRASEAPRWVEESPRDSVGMFACTVGVGSVLVLSVFAHNIVERALLEEPVRLLGLGITVVSLLAAATAAFLIEQHGRPAAFASVGRRRATAGRGAGWSPVRRVAAAAVWLVAIALAWLIVVRPVAASREARIASLVTGDLPLAAERLEEAIALDPINELYWVRLGSAAQASARVARTRDDRVRELERARRAFEHAMRLVPANSYNSINVGRVLADLARDGAARKEEVFAAFDRGLRMDPNNAYFYVDAAHGALAVGDHARATDYAARGAALYPNFGVPRSLLGHIALVAGRREEAVRILTAALAAEWHESRGPRAVAGANLAAAYLQLGRPAEALEAARDALEYVPGYVDARFNFAKALELLGRRQEAITEYRGILAQQPDYELARIALRALGA